ncbi:hypothetical protein Q9Q99_06835 [Curtobacterium flaccumfaciens]|nr:hypothetical protein Q9Q99_06835 [Curtobacterium flaccumfaciens]
MDTTTEFAVHTGDRCTAMEVAAAALRRTGHHVESTGGTMTATAGSRALTILLGALVQPAREYRRYELSTVVDGATTTISLRRAGHGTAVSGGSIGAEPASGRLARGHRRRRGRVPHRRGARDADRHRLPPHPVAGCSTWPPGAPCPDRSPMTPSAI